MGRGGEDRIHGARISALPAYRNIVGSIRPDDRSAGNDGTLNINDSWQCRDTHADHCRGIGSLRRQFRDHQSNRFSDVSYTALGKTRSGRVEGVAQIESLERNAMDKSNSRIQQIVAGENAEDAWLSQRLLGLD